MDGDGIPLAFSITEGNKNEQLTLKPLEEKILDDFKLSKFVVCTDAGLAVNSLINSDAIIKLKPPHIRPSALDFAD